MILKRAVLKAIKNKPPITAAELHILFPGINIKNSLARLVKDGEIVRTSYKGSYTLPELVPYNHKPFIKPQSKVQKKVLAVMKGTLTTREVYLLLGGTFTQRQVSSSLNWLAKTGVLQIVALGIYKREDIVMTIRDRIYEIIAANTENKVSAVYLEETLNLGQIQVRDATAYLLKKGKIIRAEAGYFTMSNENFVPSSKLSEQIISVLKIMKDEPYLTVSQIQENLEKNLTYQTIWACLATLESKGEIMKVERGQYRLKDSARKIITASEALEVSKEIITASEAIRRTHFVSLKNGNKEKAEKLGGDYMLAVLIGPGIVKEKGWGVEELFELGWSDIKKQLTLFKSPEGRPLIKGSDSYCLAFPLPVGMGFPIVPGSDPIPVFKKDIGGTATTISMNVSRMSLHY